MSKKIVLGYGLLGKEIVKQTNWDYISRGKNGIDFKDINSYSLYIYPNDIVINCIANTDTYSEEREDHWNVNYLGVIDLVKHCNLFGNKLVHISTDYIYAYSVEDAKETDVPVHARNWYSYTKLLADAHIQAMCKNYLIIRTSFKPTPFPYTHALTTQVGNFDYVDKISSMIIDLIEKGAEGVYNVGTERKTHYDLAKKRLPMIEKLDKIISPSMPVNVTMNTEKLERFINEK